MQRMCRSQAADTQAHSEIDQTVFSFVSEFFPQLSRFGYQTQIDAFVLSTELTKVRKVCDTASFSYKLPFFQFCTRSNSSVQRVKNMRTLYIVTNLARFIAWIRVAREESGLCSQKPSRCELLSGCRIIHDM